MSINDTLSKLQLAQISTGKIGYLIFPVASFEELLLWSRFKARMILSSCRRLMNTGGILF